MMRTRTASLALILACGLGVLGITAMRSGDPSGQHQPVVDSDDVLGVQCAPRVVTANTTVTVNDNHCGLIVTATATVTFPSGLGEGFEAYVFADGATATVTANTSLSVTTGTYARILVAHSKRWISALQTPANTPG